MKDGNLVTNHLNSINNVVIRLLDVDIKSLDEDNCIGLLFSLQDSWDSLVLSIDSNFTTLKFDEIVSSLFLDE